MAESGRAASAPEASVPEASVPEASGHGTVVHRAAVLGKPIAHSLSPVIHNAGYAAAGLTGWSYTRIECAAAELPALVAGLGPEWAGLSVTMPGKEAALTVAAEVSPVAAAVGAANTLVRRPDGSWYADNTDVTGMVEVLTDAGVRPGATVTVLVIARRPAALAELEPVAAALGVAMTGAPWPELPPSEASGLAGVDVLISTVPKGGRRRAGRQGALAGRHGGLRRDLRPVADPAGRRRRSRRLPDRLRPRPAAGPGDRPVRAVHRHTRPPPRDGRRPHRRPVTPLTMRLAA